MLRVALDGSDGHLVFEGVIPSGAVFQAREGSHANMVMALARSLRPLEKTRAFGMTPRLKKQQY